MREVRHEKIFYALQRAGPRHGIDRDDHGQHDQHRHHELRHALNAVFHASEDDRQRQRGKHDEADLRRDAVGDKRGKIAVGGQRTAPPERVIGQIFDDPAADDRVIRHDQDRDDCVDPAAEPQPAGCSERLERADRAFARHAAQRRLGDDHGIAERHGQQDIDQQEDPAAVFRGQIREAPDVPKANGRARR